MQIGSYDADGTAAGRDARAASPHRGPTAPRRRSRPAPRPHPSRPSRPARAIADDSGGRLDLARDAEVVVSERLRAAAARTDPHAYAVVALGGAHLFGELVERRRAGGAAFVAVGVVPEDDGREAVVARVRVGADEP